MPVSNSVKGNSLSGIAQVAPEKVVNYAEKIDFGKRFGRFSDDAFASDCKK